MRVYCNISRISNVRYMPRKEKPRGKTMYYPNAARVQQFQANFLRKMAAAGSQTEQNAQNQAVADTQRRERLANNEAFRTLFPTTGPILAPDYQKMMENTRTAWQNEEEAAAAAAAKRERIKQVLLAYAPYVGGGAALGALFGGGIGYRSGNTLAGGLLGLGGGALLGAAGKYAYDKYQKTKAPTGPVAVG